MLKKNREMYISYMLWDALNSAHPWPPQCNGPFEYLKADCCPQYHLG